MPRGTKTQPSVEQEELVASIIEYRRCRVPNAEIGNALGISEAQVSKLYKQALANHSLTAMAIDELRAEESSLIDAAVRDLLCIAHDTRLSPRSRLDAWATIVGVCSKAKRELLGLDPPTRSEVRTLGAIDAEIEQLERELNVSTRPRLPRGRST